MNIQHSTFNIQRPRTLRRGSLLECWVPPCGIECSLFVLVTCFAQSIFGQTTNTPPALVPAYGEIPPTFWEQHQTPIIIGSFAVIAFAFLFLKVMLRPETNLILPPEAVARQTLAKLQGQPEDGKLLSEVSQILRGYFSAVFELPATEMTTAEFCAAITAHEKIGAELAQTVSSFLRVCDKDKFAQKIIAPPINAIDRARDLISRSEARRAQLVTANPPQQ